MKVEALWLAFFIVTDYKLATAFHGWIVFLLPALGLLFGFFSLFLPPRALFL